MHCVSTAYLFYFIVSTYTIRRPRGPYPFTCLVVVAQGLLETALICLIIDSESRPVTALSDQRCQLLEVFLVNLVEAVQNSTINVNDCD